jgi:HK97 family phage portal protein
VGLRSAVSGLLGLNTPPVQQRDEASDEIGAAFRRNSTGAAGVTADKALRHSAVWACLRLRANLVSTLPVDVYRELAGLQVEVAKPQLLTEPFPGMHISSWLWATQYDLDRYGNCFGIVLARDAAGRPVQVEPVGAGSVAVHTKGRRIVDYRVDGERVDPVHMWHETQYRPAGSPLGLSPIAYAAWSIQGYLSAQQFALTWYSSGAAPSGTLRNTKKTVSEKAAAVIKARFRAAVEDRDVFVHGEDWEWKPAQGDASAAAFLDEMQYGATDVCRFLDVPADMIDAAASGSHITYANITQRNVQLLVTSLGPAVTRREHALSGALAKPRFVKLNTDALLRMDPETRARVLAGQVMAKLRAPSEARALDDYGPYSEEQLAEFDRLFGVPRQAAEPATQRAAIEPPPPAWAATSGWAPLDAPTVEVVGITTAPRGADQAADDWGARAPLAIESGRRWPVVEEGPRR